MSPTANTAAGCGLMLQTLPHEPMEMGCGRRRLSLDHWVCLPLDLRPVRTSTNATSQQSSAANSCPREEEMAQAVTMSLDFSFTAEEDAFARESGCETPKAKEHRIPDVDIGFCPPAPRKPCAMVRRRRVKPVSMFHAPDFEMFLTQHKMQVSS